MGPARPRRRRPALLLAGLLLLAAPPAAGEEVRAGAVMRSAGPVTSEASRKIVSRLRALMADFDALRLAPGPAAVADAAARLSSRTVRVDGAGRVQVYVAVADTAEPALEALRRRGLTVEVVNHELGLVQGAIPIGALDALAGEPVVLKIRPPSYGINDTGPVTTEGDAILRCDQARALGITGAGAIVGVISDGVSTLGAAQAAGELGSVQVLAPGPGDEGTALLEIIHDCAPDATLLFSAASTSLDFVQAVSALKGAGARIIMDDFAFLADPYFEDGPTAMNDRAVGTDILRISSAGNRGLAHYQGMFVPGAFDPAIPGTRHDFGGGDTLLRFLVPGGSNATIFLQWGNRFGMAGDDYDFCVRQPNGTLVGCSVLVQDGDDDPIESSTFECPAAPGSVCLADLQVTLFQGAPRLLELYCTNPCEFAQFNMRGDSVFGHKAVPEVLAAAAAPAQDPTMIEDFSSAGPATILFPAPETRSKPDLTAVDGVATSRPQFNPFFGTSAAAPHVAAVAALLMQANPSYALVPAQALRDALTATAVDLGPPGPDVDFGSGRVDALDAVQAELAKARCELESDRASVRVGESFTVTLRTVPGAGDPWAVFAFAIVFGPGPFTFFPVDLVTGAFGPPNTVQPSLPPGPITASSRTFTATAGFVGQVGGFCLLASPDLMRVSPFSLVSISFTP
jgi:subtilisin family serine protease